MVISVDEIIEDSDLAQAYTILRTTGQFVNGRWVQGEEKQIRAFGTIDVLSDKELRMVPEADRASGSLAFYSKKEIYTTRNTPSSSLSDRIKWRGDYYIVVSVAPYGDYGFWKAIAVRMTGD